MSSWRNAAHLAFANCGVDIDWEDRFFFCPHCGEPIYEDDWDSYDLLGDDGYICPICGDDIA